VCRGDTSGVVHPIDQPVREVRLGWRRRQTLHGFTVPARRPTRVAQHVGGDAEQPRQHAAALGQQLLVQPPGLEKGQGHHVLGGRRVTGPARRVTVHGAGEGVEQRVERGRVTGPELMASRQFHLRTCPQRGPSSRMPPKSYREQRLGCFRAWTGSPTTTATRSRRTATPSASPNSGAGSGH
jgi:hypothetical protein